MRRLYSVQEQGHVTDGAGQSFYEIILHPFLALVTSFYKNDSFAKMDKTRDQRIITNAKALDQMLSNHESKYILSKQRRYDLYESCPCANNVWILNI